MESGVVAVAAGLYHTCAIKQDSSLWCWGSNEDGQLGDGSDEDKNTPVKIIESGVVDVALGYNHTCAIKKDGSLWCWGNNEYGQIGDGTNKDKKSPVKIIESGVVSVAAGGAHTCAIKTDGSLWCWGANTSGQIGDGSAWKSTPVYIMNLGSGEGGATSIEEKKMSFGNREQRQPRCGCSGYPITFTDFSKSYN
jgi:alpha-tubulin suppressor-like RCC1 family protein